MDFNYLDIIVIIILIAGNIWLWRSKDRYSYFLWSAVPVLFFVMPFLSFGVESTLIPRQDEKLTEAIALMGMHFSKFLLYWLLTLLLLFTALYRVILIRRRGELE